MFDMAIDKIEVGTRQRKNMGDIAGLCKSIEIVGLLQPIVLNAEHKLIAGARRLAAFKKLGRTQIPSLIANNLEDARLHLTAERDENVCRLDFSPFEAVAMGRALEELERPEARKRQAQKAGGKRGEKDCSVNFTEQTSEPIRDKVGSAVGMSGPTYNRAKAVVAAAEQDPETFGAIAEEMERTGKIHPAYDKMLEIKSPPKPKPKKAKDRRTIAEGRPSKLLFKAALRALETLEEVLERVDLRGRLAKNLTAIRQEIEHESDS